MRILDRASIVVSATIRASVTVMWAKDPFRNLSGVRMSPANYTAFLGGASTLGIAFSTSKCLILIL